MITNHLLYIKTSLSSLDLLLVCKFKKFDGGVFEALAGFSDKVNGFSLLSSSFSFWFPLNLGLYGFEWTWTPNFFLFCIMLLAATDLLSLLEIKKEFFGMGSSCMSFYCAPNRFYYSFYTSMNIFILLFLFCNATDFIIYFLFFSNKF